MPLKDELIANFKRKPGAPFLFLGSGFSIRYLGLPNWAGLLREFCVMGKPYERYLSSANGYLPKTAGLIAEEFHDHWWDSPDYAESRDLYTGIVNAKSIPLRIEIGRFLESKDGDTSQIINDSAELQLLAQANVDGIITTNWDLFLEGLFPGYEVFIGQKELLFSNPQEVGEIYKIHGCRSIPDSLLLTDVDYEDFEQRNPYLAAKLTTIFVEHPVIFLGYSLSDPHIVNLIRSIALCIGTENVEKLRNNLIFVEYTPGVSDGIVENTELQENGVLIPLLTIKLEDYSPIYEALNETRRKIPAKVLRVCKKQFYELIEDRDPNSKLAVVDYDQIDENTEIEFVVGIGVAKVGDRGYVSIKTTDLFEDLIDELTRHDANRIIEKTLPSLQAKYLPIFQYLSRLQINSQADYEASGLDLSKFLRLTAGSYQNRQYYTTFRSIINPSVANIVAGRTPKKAVMLLPFLDQTNCSLPELLEFLKQNRAALSTDTNFRKLATFYDRLKWGWGL